MEVCTICGTTRDLDRHHIIHRGMGGGKNPEVSSDANLTTLCRKCHHGIHEGGWVLERSPSLVRVVESRTGMEIMRRHRDPNFDATRFLGALNLMEVSLAAAVAGVIYLNDDQLVEAFEASRSIGKRAWLIQAAILYEAQRRSVHGDHAVEAIARRFSISLNMAEKYARAWREFFAEAEREEIFNVEEIFLEEPSWYVVAASESPEPQRWLAYAQDRKAEDPRYSIGDFRRDIQRATGASVALLEHSAAAGVEPGERVPWDCPWVEPYCTRSGRPVPAPECPCDE